MRRENGQPDCQWCGKSLRPNYDSICIECGLQVHSHKAMDTSAPNNNGCPHSWQSLSKNRKLVTKWLKDYGRVPGMFCTYRHAVWFAEAAVEQGFKLKSRKSDVYAQFAISKEEHAEQT